MSFGFGCQSPSGGLFDHPQRDGGLFGNTTDVSAAPSKWPPGTTIFKYSPLLERDVLNSGASQKIKFLCITCMKEYESKSLEELRLEDYQAGRKPSTENQPAENKPLFGSNQPAENKLLFGFNQPAENKLLFGSNQPAENKLLFGSNQPAENKSLFGFKQPEDNKSLFGFNQPAENKPLFGTKQPTENKLLFGFNQPAENKPLFGFNQPAENKPLFGTKHPTENKLLFGFNQPAENKPLFGSKQTTENKPLFGAQACEYTYCRAPLHSAQCIGCRLEDNTVVGYQMKGSFGETSTKAPMSPKFPASDGNKFLNFNVGSKYQASAGGLFAMPPPLSGQQFFTVARSPQYYGAPRAAAEAPCTASRSTRNGWSLSRAPLVRKR